MNTAVSSKSGNRILILSLDTLGDIVLRQPLFKGLLDNGHKVTILVRDGYEEILPFLDNRLSFITTSINPYSNSDAYKELFKECCEKISSLGPDTIICGPFQKTFVDECILRLFSDSYRIGFGSGTSSPSLKEIEDHLHISSSGEIFDCSVVIDENVLETEKNRELLSKALGKDIVSYKPEIKISSEQSKNIEPLLASLNLERNKFIICSPGGGVATVKIKAWPTQKYAETLAHIQSKFGLSILLVGQDCEKDIIDEVIAKIDELGGSAKKWIGRPGELELLVGLLDAGRMYIGNDTGSMHIAAALDKNVLAIFGGGHWPRFLPSGKAIAVVKELPCFNCGWECIFSFGPCSKLIPTSAVEKACSTILTGNSPEVCTILHADVFPQTVIESLVYGAKLKNIQKDQEIKIRDVQISEWHKYYNDAMEAVKNRDQQLEEWSQRYDDVRKQYDNAVRQIQEMEASRSWRLTKPLRVTINKLRILKNNIRQFKFNLSKSVKSLISKPEYAPKIDLSKELGAYFGKHRSGWMYGLKSLEKLHKPRGIKFDSFIERTFVWNPEEIRPHLEPWIGFIHVPPKVPKWFLYEQSNESVFNTEAFQKSLPHCKGLFTLSRYHKDDLEKRLGVPVNNLLFTTEVPELKWDMQRFVQNEEKKIVQIGWWLRKLHTIYMLETTKYKKVFLKATHIKEIDDLLLKERKILEEEGAFDPKMYQTVQVLPFLSDEEYDVLLSENIAILNLYDTSANNAITECIVRNTPILVNPLDAVVEYLGKDYPFYFSSLEEAVKKAEDFNLVRDTHEYLLNHPIKEKLKGEYFLKSFAESEIYKSL